MNSKVLNGRKVHGGVAEGEALVTTEALGGYGAFNVETGEVIEVGHPWHGKSLAGKILVFRGAKGSSSWSIWHQALGITGRAPKAYVVLQSNSQIALGAAILRIPAVADLDRNPVEAIRTGDWIRVHGDSGTVEILRNSAEQDASATTLG